MRQNIIVLALCVLVALVTCTDLDNGRYQVVHLRDHPFAQHRFDLDLPRFHREQVHIVAVPYGCDAPVDIYVGVERLPTNTSHDFASKENHIGRTSWVACNLTQSGDAKAERVNILIETKARPGQVCSVYVMAHAQHTQSLVVLERSVPQWGVFHVQAAPQHPYIHWYEFDLGEHHDESTHALNFLVTSLEGGDLKKEHYTYNAYVSGDNSRPNPTQHQWASLSLDDGDAFIQITRHDPHFKRTGKYYVAVVLAENPQPSNAAAEPSRVHYTVTAQIVKNNVQTKPVVLLNNLRQVGVSSGIDHIAHFTFFVDAERVNKPVKLLSEIRTGSIKIYASSKTSHPDKHNHEFTSDGKDLEMTFKEPSFVYVGVETQGKVVSSYDLEFRRE